MFAFDLAKELKCPNVDAMLASIPLPLFFEWMEYAKRNPFGEERADLRIAMMASALMNKHPYGQGRTRPIDFMPFSKGERHEPEPSLQILADLKGMAALHKRHSDKIAEIDANRQ